MAVDPWIEEVRVALALNGGVSLAVWMGGCAVELDGARRERCAWEPESPTTTIADRSIYGALCDAFRRELVVDVMTGSSAGGINGALLAGAMANRRELLPNFLRNRWLDLGDFSKLLKPTSAVDPKALMRGDYFGQQLRLTFDALLATAESPLRAVIPALDVTTTDTAGRPLEFRDAWGGKIYAREHRALFEFRELADFDATNLAAAARASASFPLAFEPFTVPDETRALAQLGLDSWLIDGGVLNNAPIETALNLIPGRAATRQVRRFLCYLNGDPAALTQANVTSPSPREVIGILVNLPRKAPDADYLIALQGLARRSPLGHEAQLALMAVALSDLEATAGTLLPTYRHRRRLRVLQDLLRDPGDAQRAFDAIEESSLELPWLPPTLYTPADLWPWGFEAARRVHHLAIDLLRAALPGASSSDRRALLTVRAAIDSRLDLLEQARGTPIPDLGPDLDAPSLARRQLAAIAAGGDPQELLAPLATLTQRVGTVLAAGIEQTARELFGVSVALGARSGVAVDLALFGESWSGPEGRITDEMLATFRRRVVAIEVVRRSFLDELPVDDGQEIVFAQLTPDAPAPIFDAHPFTAPRLVSADFKLCGTILGHFGAFYRRSWRANDFLWGRLDASARIIQMLVSPLRATALRATDDDLPWVRLADQLYALALFSPEQRSLLEEALGDLTDEPTEGELLYPVLLSVLTADLQSPAGDGSRTRILCTRAAQFEILCDELPCLVAEVVGDEILGSSPSTIGIEDVAVSTPAGVLDAVIELRDAGLSLPQALGRDSKHELTSDLGVRTVARAGLVALGMTREVGGRIALPLAALRSLLLPLAGAVSRDVGNRFGVAAAFGAAALYLGARLANTNPSNTIELDNLSTPGLALAFVALLVVIGAAGLPIARAVGGRGLTHRVTQGTIGFMLIVSGAAGGIVLASLGGHLTLAHLVIAPGVVPPWYVTVPPLMLGAGAVWSAPKRLRPILQRFSRPAWRGTSSLVMTFVAALIIAVWAQDPLRDALASDADWQRWTAILALVAVALALLVVFASPGRRAQRADA